MKTYGVVTRSRVLRCYLLTLSAARRPVALLHPCQAKQQVGLRSRDFNFHNTPRYVLKMASTSPKAIVRSSRHVSCLDTIYRIYSDLYKIDLSDASTLIFDEFILLLLESLHLLGHQRHIAHWRAEYHVVKNYGKTPHSPLPSELLLTFTSITSTPS